MKNIRIEAMINSRILLVDVMCDCGRNSLTDEASGEESFRHAIRIGSNKDKILVCDCGKKYRLHPQGTHLHVFSEGHK